MCQFIALPADVRQGRLIVLDLGYAPKRKSSGVAWPEGRGKLTFGDAIRKVTDLFGDEVNKDAVLVLEGVLSTYHNGEGNPDIRGCFEQKHGWYLRAGVLTLASACRFLQQVGRNLEKRQVLLAEAFLTTPMDHAHAADLIARQFWETQPENLRDGVEPASEFIKGVPPVRSFEP